MFTCSRYFSIYILIMINKMFIQQPVFYSIILDSWWVPPGKLSANGETLLWGVGGVRIRQAAAGYRECSKRMSKAQRGLYGDGEAEEEPVYDSTKIAKCPARILNTLCTVQ